MEKYSNLLREKKGISFITLGIVIGVLVIVAIIAIGLSYFLKRDTIQAKKEEMYQNDRNAVQEALLNAAIQVQEKYKVTVVISKRNNISDGIVYTLNGLNNSAITGGKMGWKSKATNATVTQDTSIILGVEMPIYSGVNFVWSTDSHGNVVLNVNGKEYTAAEGTNLNASLKNSLTSLGDGTNKIEEAKSKKIPYVPVGFSHVSGTTIENGYVIQDSQIVPNQYVWVPVKNMNNWKNEVKEYYEKEAEEYATIKKSVEDYGGFYVGRYEASNDNLRAASKQNQKPWTNISWGQSMNNISGGATYYAKQVKNDYGYVDFKSGLVNEAQWKDILSFIKKTEKSDSTSWGNYMDATFTIVNTNAMYAKMNPEDWSLTDFVKVESSIKKEATDYKEEWKETGKKFKRGGWLVTTGASDNFSIRNIYDIAGNVEEWLATATSDETRATVGGSYRDFGKTVFAGTVRTRKPNEGAENIGFRVMLYL